MSRVVLVALLAVASGACWHRQPPPPRPVPRASTPVSAPPVMTDFVPVATWGGRNLVPDATFGLAGRAAFGVEGLQHDLTAVVAAPDGSLYAAGDQPFGTVGGCVTHYLPDGAVDLQFGERGVAHFGGLHLRAGPLALASDGSLFVGGYDYDANAVRDVVVTRLLRNGVPDPTFGTDGVASFALDDMTLTPSAIFARTDGGVVLVANAAKRTPDPLGRDDAAMVVVHLDARGARELRFARSGISKLDVLPGHEIVTSALLGTDGSLLAAGYSSSRTSSFVARVRPDGAPEVGFGERGVVEVANGDLRDASSLAVDHAGRIYLGGKSRLDDAAVVRLEPGGARDTTFGRDGLALGPDTTGDTVDALLVTPDGGVLAIGVRLRDEVGGPSAEHVQRLVMIAFDPHGSVGPAFGDAGVRLGEERDLSSVAATIDRSGRVIVAGSGDSPGTAFVSRWTAP